MWNVLAASRKKKTYSVGTVVKKSSGGLWFVRTEGRKVLATPLTDEPIQLGSRVRLTGADNFAQRPMILGAEK